MLVVITEKQILSPQQVCCDCLLASQKGLPRWHEGKLGCSRHKIKQGKNQQNPPTSSSSKQAVSEIYECQMGFRLANVEGSG